MKNILAFGGGVDSTPLVIMQTDREWACDYLRVTKKILDAALPPVDAVVFSDPGAEWKQTYENVETARTACTLAGLRFEVVRKGEVPGTGSRETITEWVTRLGVVPLMPGGSHVCSLKFKAEIMQRWAENTFPGEPINWQIGIEADERGRKTRFTVQDTGKEKRHGFVYPLIELSLTRSDCVAIIEAYGWPPVHKSSCVFCPFMQPEEIRDVYENNPEGWQIVKQVEDRFKEESPKKHGAWLAAGSPRTKSGRAPQGMWSRDSWAEGARLFARGNLSVAQWEREFTRTDYQLSLF